MPNDNRRSQVMHTQYTPPDANQKAKQSILLLAAICARRLPPFAAAAPWLEREGIARHHQRHPATIHPSHHRHHHCHSFVCIAIHSPASPPPSPPFVHLHRRHCRHSFALKSSQRHSPPLVDPFPGFTEHLPTSFISVPCQRALASSPTTATTTTSLRPLHNQNLQHVPSPTTTTTTPPPPPPQPSPTCHRRRLRRRRRLLRESIHPRRRYHHKPTLTSSIQLHSPWEVRRRYPPFPCAAMLILLQSPYPRCWYGLCSFARLGRPTDPSV